jgi:hypothetical protein
VAITLDRALENIHLYNENASFVRIDRSALALFAGGLGTSAAAVELQLRFIAQREGYAAINWSKRSRVLPQDTPLIARELLRNRDAYLHHMESLGSPLETSFDPVTISKLLAPFIKSERWLVWAAKTWHFLKPATFPILDRYAASVLEHQQGARLQSLENTEIKYCAFVNALRVFVRPRQEWLAHMRAADGRHYWSDWKLWDKVLFQEFDRRKRG